MQFDNPFHHGQSKSDNGLSEAKDLDSLLLGQAVFAPACILVQDADTI